MPALYLQIVFSSGIFLMVSEFSSYSPEEIFLVDQRNFRFPLFSPLHVVKRAPTTATIGWTYSTPWAGSD